MKKRIGLSGSQLKTIALIIMVIDHIAAGILHRGLFTSQYCALVPASLWTAQQVDTMVLIYNIMRKIGRLSFPIFCYFLVEGFEHTQNVLKYCLRLFLFALISEIPFDLALRGEMFYFKHQNVLFTFFLGVLLMAFLRRFANDIYRPDHLFICVIATAAVAAAAWLTHVDYRHYGIISIALLYVLREYKIPKHIAGAVSFAYELPAPAAFIFTWFYNGERGRGSKYFFYIFYPAHLLLIWMICFFVIPRMV